MTQCAIFMASLHCPEMCNDTNYNAILARRVDLETRKKLQAEPSRGGARGVERTRLSMLPTPITREPRVKRE